MKLFPSLLLSALATTCVFAQEKKIPLLRSSKYEVLIMDGPNFRLKWGLDPNINMDTYYVNIPRLNSKVTFQTDKGEISFKTSFGQEYYLNIIVNEKDTCHVRIRAKDESGVRHANNVRGYPDTIPITMKGTRAYLTGRLNGEHPVTIQLDLGAGGTVVNKMVADKLPLNFDGKTSVTNTQGTNEARRSSGNTLNIGNLEWKKLQVTEVGNMDADEDMIIGNYLFRDKVIELDYDRMVMIISEQLPKKAKNYKQQPVIYEQSRPSFKVTIRHNNQPFTSWFLFDTGRKSAMNIGQDLTGQKDNWKKLQPLIVKPDKRKVVRLDATIGGVTIKDIVTNAADPNDPVRRVTLFGNELLNHFNMILDNQKGLLYLKPNARMNEPYTNYANYLKTNKE